MIERSTLFFMLLLLIGCSPSAAPPNQRQEVTSPSGRYVLSLPIEPQTTNPQYKGTPVWKVTISDAAGTLLYKDEASTMVGSLNVYWGWDAQDRVWVYNSDDGTILCWALSPSGWSHIESPDDSIPDFVLPDYAKGR